MDKIEIIKDPQLANKVPEKLCVFCKNWSFSGGSADYSDVTPGEQGKISCMKQHYCHRMYKIQSEMNFRLIIEIAENCPDYEVDDGK